MNPHDVTGPTEEEQEIADLRYQLGVATYVSDQRHRTIESYRVEARALRIENTGMRASILRLLWDLEHAATARSVTDRINDLKAAVGINSALSQTKGGAE